MQYQSVELILFLEVWESHILHVYINKFFLVTYVFASIYISNLAIVIMSWQFTNDHRDRGLNPGRVIPKTQKMILDVALFSTQH